MCLSSELSCEAGSLSHCCPNCHEHSQSEVGGFISPSWSPGLLICFTPPPFLLVYLHWNVGLQGLLAVLLPVLLIPQSTTSLGPTTLLKSSLPWLPISAPPTSLDECFFFISLVVRLLCSLVFCQFWLFFVFKLLLFFFWLCEEAQCVYLRLHLGRKSPVLVFL